jgi:WD40 repeat protein
MLRRFIVTGSKDMSARLYSLNPIPGFVPVTLGGHKSTIVQAAFASTGDVIYTVSKDGACFVWEWKERSELSASALSAVDGKDGGSDSDDAAAPRKLRRGPSTVSALVTRDRRRVVPDPCAGSEGQSFSILNGEWRLVTKHFFKQDNAKVCSCVQCLSQVHSSFMCILAGVFGFISRIIGPVDSGLLKWNLWHLQHA